MVEFFYEAFMPDGTSIYNNVRPYLDPLYFHYLIPNNGIIKCWEMAVAKFHP